MRINVKIIIIIIIKTIIIIMKMIIIFIIIIMSITIIKVYINSKRFLPPTKNQGNQVRSCRPTN